MYVDPKILQEASLRQSRHFENFLVKNPILGRIYSTLKMVKNCLFFKEKGFQNTQNFVRIKLFIIVSSQHSSLCSHMNHFVINFRKLVKTALPGVSGGLQKWP